MHAAKKKKSVLLLIAAIIGLAYSIYLIAHFTGAGSNAESTAESIGVGIATALVTPHMICTMVAVIFNILGWAMNKAGFALVAGILYAVAAVLFFMYAMFVVVEMVLCFVGYARLHKTTKQYDHPEE